MANEKQIRAAVEAHGAAVGRADADSLARLYAADAELQDPAGTTAAVGRSAIGQYFANVLTQTRETELLFVSVIDHQAAVHFRATPAGGPPRDVIDTMTFNEQGAITSMKAYAG